MVHIIKNLQKNVWLVSINNEKTAELGQNF